MWQAAIAALIRNAASWRFFEPGEELLEGAVQVCRRFLDEDPILFHPAIGAWQFLLTFEMAQRDRRDANGLARVRKAIADVMAHDRATNSYWFGELRRLYASRHGLAEAFPQMTEVVLGLTRHEVVPQDVIDYFLRVRIHHTYILRRAVETGSRTPYMTPDRMKTIDMGSRTILTNYGFMRRDWNRLRKMDVAPDIYRGIPRESMQLWDSIFSSGTSPTNRSDWEKWEAAEALSVETFRAAYPFSRLDEQRAARVAVGREITLEEVARRFRDARAHDDPLRALWLAPAGHAAHQLARAFNLKDDEIPKFESSDQLPESTVDSQKAFVERFWEEHLQRILRRSVAGSELSNKPEAASLAKKGIYGSIRSESNHGRGLSEAQSASDSRGSAGAIDIPHRKEGREMRTAYRTQQRDVFTEDMWEYVEHLVAHPDEARKFMDELDARLDASHNH